MCKNRSVCRTQSEEFNAHILLKFLFAHQHAHPFTLLLNLVVIFQHQHPSTFVRICKKSVFEKIKSCQPRHCIHLNPSCLIQNLGYCSSHRKLLFSHCLSATKTVTLLLSVSILYQYFHIHWSFEFATARLNYLQPHRKRFTNLYRPYAVPLLWYQHFQEGVKFSVDTCQTIQHHLLCQELLRTKQCVCRGDLQAESQIFSGEFQQWHHVVIEVEESIVRVGGVLKSRQPQQQAILQQVHMAVFPNIRRHPDNVDQEVMQAFTFLLREPSKISLVKGLDLMRSKAIHLAMTWWSKTFTNLKL